MRLIDVNDALNLARCNPAISDFEVRVSFERNVRGRLPEVRPSALAKRGEPALSELRSLAFHVPDDYRYCRLCRSMDCEHARVMRELARWESHTLHVDPVPGCHLCENAAEYERDLARSIAFQEAGEE